MSAPQGLIEGDIMNTLSDIYAQLLYHHDLSLIAFSLIAEYLVTHHNMSYSEASTLIDIMMRNTKSERDR